QRPYVCPECGYAFQRKHDLARHRKGHTGERPYVCSHCSKAFSRIDAYQKH
ncbi:hypothetical protein BJ742DRAFT_668103, partial [Cladochytrium replicatum]